MKDVEGHLVRATRDLETFVAQAQDGEQNSTQASFVTRRLSRVGRRSRDDRRSFADFYDVMSPGVVRFFARATGEADRAFDLTAETFAKAFEKRGEFNGTDDAQAAAWLWMIARGELARFQRTRAVELAALGRLGLERPTPTEEDLHEIERVAAADEVRQHLESALKLLPADQREVVWLRFITGLSYAEIAARVGASVDVVRARTSRALNTLRSSEDTHEALADLEA